MILQGTRPIGLLDVDGALSPTPEVDRSFPDHELVVLDEETSLLLRRSDGDWLMGLGADLMWATTRSDPHAIGDKLGWPRLPVVEIPRELTYTSRPKLEALFGVLASGRPAFWIDDWINPAIADWARERTAPFLLVRTDFRVGLTLDQRPLVELFCGMLEVGDLAGAKALADATADAIGSDPVFAA